MSLQTVEGQLLTTHENLWQQTTYIIDFKDMLYMYIYYIYHASAWLIIVAREPGPR